MAGDVAASGVYGVEGQEAQANILAFGTEQAPEQDDSAMDGGQVVDIGEYQQPAEDQQESRLSPADEARLEFDVEQSSQLVEQAEAEQASKQQEQAYAEALENYEKLDTEGRQEVNAEWIGRASEQMSEHVDPALAQEMTQDMFGDMPGTDPVAAATLLGVGCRNIIDSLEAAGVTSLDELTPEVVQSVNDPSVAQVWVNQFLPAIGLGGLLPHVNAAQ
jgi:hypothetical protein